MATELIARHGYEAMSMRALADRVGVQAAALYRYFPTKQELLFALMQDHMLGVASAWEQARPASADPALALAAFVDNHIQHHIARRHSTHLANMELRSLSPENLTLILRMRAAYERELRQILRQGTEKRIFTIDDIELTAMAIIQMLTGVIVWFRPGDRLSVEDVCKTYRTMTLRLVGATVDREVEHV